MLAAGGTVGGHVVTSLVVVSGTLVLVVVVLVVLVLEVVVVELVVVVVLVVVGAYGWPVNVSRYSIFHPPPVRHTSGWPQQVPARSR